MGKTGQIQINHKAECLRTYTREILMVQYLDDLKCSLGKKPYNAIGKMPCRFFQWNWNHNWKLEPQRITEWVINLEIASTGIKRKKEKSKNKLIWNQVTAFVEFVFLPLNTLLLKELIWRLYGTVLREKKKKRLRDTISHLRLLKEATKTTSPIISVSITISIFTIPMANLYDIIFEENSDDFIIVTDGVPKSYSSNK